MKDEDKKLFDAMLDFEEDEVIEQVDIMLNGGRDPMSIVNTCKEAMNEVGRLFQEKEFFLTELIMAGELFNVIMDKLGFGKGELKKDASNAAGTVIMGTVAGDVHDIGKNIVCSLLRSNDYEVIDIGVEVPVSKFIEEIKRHRPQVVGMCGLLTIAYDAMKETIEAITDAGLREGLHIMIGGGSIDQDVCNYVGADAYGKDAADAVKLVQEWIGK